MYLAAAEVILVIRSSLFSDHLKEWKVNHPLGRCGFFTCRLPAAFTLKDVGHFRSSFVITLKTLKCSSGHEECSFDNRAEKFLPKVRRLLGRSTKIYENLCFFSKKFLKSFLWTRRKQFRQPCRYFSQ